MVKKKTYHTKTSLCFRRTITVTFSFSLNQISFEAGIPNEVAYTDDVNYVNFIGQNYADIKEIQEIL